MRGKRSEKEREGREEEMRGGEGGEGRGQDVVMWPRRLSALNPPLITVW